MDQVIKQIIVATGVPADMNSIAERTAFYDDNGEQAQFPATGDTVVMTGYVPGVDDSVEATDTLNEAIAKLEALIIALDERIVVLEGP